MPDADRAAQISARLAAATPGPWRQDDEYGYSVFSPSAESWVAESGEDWGIAEKANAIFIANAPADLAWLLAERVELLRLLDAERARADAAEARKADVWSEGWGAAGEAFVEGLLAEASGQALPQSDGPPNPYR